MTAPDRVKRRLQLDSPVGSSSSSSWALVTGGAGLKGAEFDADVYQMHVHATWSRQTVLVEPCYPKACRFDAAYSEISASTAERGREVFQATLCNRLVEPSKDIGWEPKW